MTAQGTVVTWRLLFHWLPTPLVEGDLCEILAPIEHVQRPDYDPRRYDDGLHEVILTGAVEQGAVEEIATRCLGQARTLMQPGEGGRDWEVSADRLQGIMNPTWWGTNPTTSPIPELYGASYSISPAGASPPRSP